MDKHDGENLISRRAFARLKRLAPSWVMDLCQQGRISLFVPCPKCEAIVNTRVEACDCGQAIAGVVDTSRAKIDPELAEQEMAASSDPSKDHVRDRFADQRGAPAHGDASSDDGETVLSFAEAKKLAENFRARTMELEYREKAGSVCSVDAVENAAATASRATRDALTGIADRLSPILAAESDPNTIHELLTTEINKGLSAVHKELEKYAKRNA